MSELSLAARAWEDVKAVDDPSFENCTADHRNNLTERADGVVRTGETINLFEEKVKELNALDIKNAPETALGTTELNRVVETGAKAKAEAKAEAKADAKEKADAEADAKAKADEKADEKAKANIQAHKFPIIK